MKIKKYILGIASVLMLIFSACEKPFDALEQDPNRAVHVPASLVLQGVEYNMFYDNGVPFSAEMRWNQFYCSNYNYYATNEYTWTSFRDQYAALKNVVKMEEEAVNAGLPAVNAYSAVGKFFRAYFFDQMSKRAGDLPMNEALKGISNTKPVYDSQKTIYIQILKWLEEANTELAGLISSGSTLTGDFYYGGDLKKWQKAVNAMRLRVLIGLSKKESDADLGIKTKFAEMIGNPSKYPLFSSMSENLEFKFNNFNKYPSNPDNFGFDATRQNMSKAYIEPLTKMRDPRVMVTCEPAGFELKSGKKPSDYTAFVGASSAEDLADMSSKAGVDNGAGFAPGKYSFQSRSRYYKNYTAENTFILGYPELCFNIAEGIARGWASGSAEDWYKKGIQASMSFYGIKDGTLTMTYSRNGSKEAAEQINYTIDFNFETYYNQDLVKLTQANAIQQIVTQKYLAFFMNSGMEAYFNWRRTGFPTLYTGVGNGNSGRIALRWQYPLSERTINKANYDAAISRQFGGKDDINDQIWLIK